MCTAHSSPGEALMEERLRHFLGFMEPVDLWVNPDCGLKTRTWDEVRRQVGEMVGAAWPCGRADALTAGGSR